MMEFSGIQSSLPFMPDVVKPLADVNQLKSLVGNEGASPETISLLSPERVKELRTSFSQPKTAGQQKLKDAAQQFESVFLNQLLEAMEKTVDREESMLDGGEAESTFRGMLYQEMATSISKAGGNGIGLASSIYQQTVLMLGNETENLNKDLEL
jgi:Rod binding domain-containing protein